MFHKSQLIIAGLLFSLLVLSAKAPDPKAIVAKVGDRSYSYKVFNDGFKAYLEYHGRGKSYTAQDSVRMNNQYWEELVGIYVYDQAIKAGKIKITNAELEAEINKNVPDGVKQIKDFHTNGKFDSKKYEQALKDKPDFKKMVIDNTKDMYSYRKLISTVKKEVSANPDSVKASWTKQNDLADASIIYFDYNKLKDITVTDDEARLYYEAHKEDYKRENGRGYIFARFTGVMSKAENAESTLKDNKNKSAALYTRAKEVGLVKAAGEQNIPLEESSIFNAQDEIIPRIGRAPTLTSFAYQNAIGTIPDVYYAPTGDIMVLELNRELPEYYIDFELKKPEILVTSTRTKRMFSMDNYVQNFLATETPDTYLAAALRDSLAVIEATAITIDSEIKALSKIPALNQAILSTTSGSFTPLIEKDKHWYLAKVIKRTLPDFSLWEKDKKTLIEEANTQLQQDHLNKWYLNERSKIELVDNRHEYYPIRQLIKM